MKLITAVVRPERLPQVKAALFRAGVTGITISRVSGHGGERDQQEQYRGSTVVLEFREKVRLEKAGSEPFGEPTNKANITSPRTRQVGDGEIILPAPTPIGPNPTGEGGT